MTSLVSINDLYYVYYKIHMTFKVSMVSNYDFYGMYDLHECSYYLHSIYDLLDGIYDLHSIYYQHDGIYDLYEIYDLFWNYDLYNLWPLASIT